MLQQSAQDNLAMLCESYTVTDEGKVIIGNSNVDKTESVEECLICCESNASAFEEVSTSSFVGLPIKDCDCACKPTSSCDPFSGNDIM